MSKNSIPLNLIPQDIEELRNLQHIPKLKQRISKRCNALLWLNNGMPESEVANLLGFKSVSTITNLKKRYNEKGLSDTLYDAPRPGRPIEITPEERARITALACTTAPEGRSRWTMRLLGEKAVEMELIDGISHTSVSDILKKTN